VNEVSVVLEDIRLIGSWEESQKLGEALFYDKNGNGWLRTGDEAVYNADDYCTITDSFKDVIIRCGENVSARY
jgi:mevalonyl-CoA ligase